MDAQQWLDLVRVAKNLLETLESKESIILSKMASQKNDGIKGEKYGIRKPMQEVLSQEAQAIKETH